jgi:3-isopropylmalate/(R)-2-methylmalate dehydratase large subunit
VRQLPVEARLTLCNLTIEMGARTGLVAPDQMTFDWLAGRPWAPEGVVWDTALAYWRTLKSDEDAEFDADVDIDCTGLEPQITWGTDPSQVIGVSEHVPDPQRSDAARRAGMQRALEYMGLEPGTPLAGVAIDRAFIGSCTNNRLSDLQTAAAIVRGRRVAPNVTAMVVPGSSTVKRQAEAAGLDKVFQAAGFSWGESGCSMCAGSNGDRGRPGERCISTTNRNFEHRQGTRVRTHLASPASVAAAAVAGHIVDVRRLAAGAA